MTAPKRKLPPGIRELPNGRYQARYTVNVAGQSRQHSAGVFDTVTEAKQALAVRKGQLYSGEHVDPVGPRMTFARWSDDFIELCDLGDDKRVQSFLRVHLLPQWGHWRIGDIKVADVQLWVNSLFSSGLASSSAAAVYALFKRILGRAVDYDRLVKSPCRLIRLPRATKGAPVTLSVADLRALEQAAPDRFKAMVHLAAWAGLRWQECAALQWADVDLQRGVLHIHQAVKVTGELGTTKNRQSRNVVVSPATVEVLRRHRRDFGGQDFVFTGGRLGRMLYYSGFRQYVWLATVERSGVQGNPTFHDLRHAYVGHMVAAGLDAKVISDQVGHHAASFTMDRYGWTRPDHDAIIAAAVEKAQAS